MNEWINCGVFGPKLSGKTTLAKRLVADIHRTTGRRALVLDPHFEDWPPCCFLAPKRANEAGEVYAAEDEFWRVVWNSENMVVVVEEAAATIRRDRDLVPVFTRLRHCHHRLLVIGHSGMDLLPVMRQQLDCLFLFRQPESAAKVWAETFTEKGLLQATELRQFEFIRCQLYQPPQKFLAPKP